MLQIFHRRRKGTLGAAFLALLLVVSAWPCPQNVEAQGQQTKSPKVITLNDAEVFKKRTNIASLNLSSTTSDYEKIGILETEKGTEWVPFNSLQPLSDTYLQEMAALLRDYRMLAGVQDPEVNVLREFQEEDAKKGLSPQNLAFINMCMGESSGNYHHNYLSDDAKDLLEAIQKAPNTAIPAEQKDAIKIDSIYNRSNLLMDGSVSSSLLKYTVNDLNQLQERIVDEFKKGSKAEINDFRFVNGFPLDNLTAKGPISGWIQEGYDYHSSIQPDQHLPSNPSRINLGHRANLLQPNLKTLRIGAVAGKEFQVPAHYIDSSDPNSRVMQSGPYMRYNAAGWINVDGENKYDEKADSVIAFPAPGVFPLEFINPQCTVWTLELDPEVYSVTKSEDLTATIAELHNVDGGAGITNNRKVWYDADRKDASGRQIIAIEPPKTQLGTAIHNEDKVTKDNFPSIYNLAPLEGKAYVVTLTGVKDKKTGEDITIQYWVQYKLIKSLPEDSPYYLSQDKAAKISEWITKRMKSGSSEPQPTGPSTDPTPTSEPTTKPTTEPTTEPSTTPTLPAPRPTDDSSSRGPQLPPPPKPGGSSSKYGNWNKSNKDGSNDEDDDESDTLFGSKYSRNRGPQSKQLRFQGPMAAPQGPGNQFPAGQLSGQPSPMPLAPQNMGQGVNPQGVNQMAMPQGVNQAAMPVAANNVLQQVPETGEVSFQPWVLGALLGAVALVLAKKRKF